MTNGFFHFLNLNKVNNSTRNEPNTKLNKEMHKVPKIINIGSHNNHIQAHNELYNK